MIKTAARKFGLPILALFSLAALVFLSGCASQPDANSYYANCCLQNSTVPAQCNGEDADCSNSDGYNVCYNLSANPPTVLAPICPQFNKTACVQGDCIAMVCSKARKQFVVPVTSDDRKADSLPPGAASTRSGGLINKYCRFTPLDAKTTLLMKKEKEAFVNTVRLGIAGDFSDYDRSRFYFPLSDYWGAPLSREATTDRFVRYLGATGECDCQNRYLYDPLPPNAGWKWYYSLQRPASTVSGISSEAECLALPQQNPKMNDNCDWTVNPGTARASVPLCEPRNDSNAITYDSNTKWTCAEKPGSVSAGDIDYIISEYGGSDELAQIACMIGCRGNLACNLNPDLLVKSVDISAPTATGADRIPPRPFVNIGRLDQFNSPWTASTGKGYGQELFEAYKSTPSRFTSQSQPGPFGGYDYECSAGKDCYSGICRKDIYQRSACLIQKKDANGNPLLDADGNPAYDTADCQCVVVDACEQWFSDCDSYPPDTPGRDGCRLGNDICNSAKQGGFGKMILCHHDNSWKGRDNRGRYNQPPIQYDQHKDFMSIEYYYWKKSDYFTERVFYGPVRQAMWYDDWAEHHSDFFRTNYPGEMVRNRAFYEGSLPPGCVENSSGRLLGYNTQADCNADRGTWANHSESQDAQSYIHHGYLNYLRAFTAVPEWQAITYGTAEAPFNTTTAVRGGAFIFASPGYRTTDYDKNRPVPDANRWTGTFEQMLSTFPIISACRISQNEIEEVDMTSYGYMGTSRAYPPGTHADEDGNPSSPSKIWRIKSFGDCATDQNGWPIIRTYGLCEPRTFMTMSYQKVEDAYADGSNAIGPYSHYWFGKAGYCPSDCKQKYAMCECPAYYGSTKIPKYGEQAVHTNPELGWLSYAIATHQSDFVMPVLDITEYTFKNSPPPQYQARVTFNPLTRRLMYDPCVLETGSSGKLICVKKQGGQQQPDLVPCEMGLRGYDFRQLCTMPNVPDPLMYFLSQNHSATVLITNHVTDDVDEIDARTSDAVSACKDCIITLDFPRYLESFAGNFSPLDVMNFQAALQRINSTLKQLTGVDDDDGPATKDLMMRGPQSPVRNVDLLLLRLHVLTGPYSNGGTDVFVNNSIAISRHVLHHTGWPTIWHLTNPGTSLSVGGQFDERSLYLNISARLPDIAKAGVIGIMLPGLNGSMEYFGLAGEDYGHPPWLVQNDPAVAPYDKFQTSPAFCAAQYGTQGFIRPKIVSSTIKLPVREKCACSLCSKEEVELGLCNPTCLDGRLCGDKSASVGVKCEPLCSRASECVPCDELTCVRATSTPTGLQFGQKYVVTVDNNEAYGAQIGSMQYPCCIEANMSSAYGVPTLANMTFKTEYRIQTSAELDVYPKYANNETDCSLTPGKIEPPAGALCIPGKPLLDDYVEVCVQP